MAEYIERKAAIDVIMSEPTDAHYPSWYADKIEQISVADVAPVKHGQWIKGKSGIYECSYCGKSAPYSTDSEYLIEYWPALNYCPNCGADMRGDGNG